MTVIAARCDAVYAADCSRSTVRRISSEPGCSARETAHGEDPRPGIMRPLYRDGGVGLDAGVRHDHDRVFGGEGIGVGVEGEVERGDGPRVRPGGAQQPGADQRRVQAGADADHEDPPRRGQQGGRLLCLIPAVGEQAPDVRRLALHGLVHLRVGRRARSHGRSFRGRSPPYPGPHDDESGQHQSGPEQLQGAKRLSEENRR